jgi:hypothetical protein
MLAIVKTSSAIADCGKPSEAQQMSADAAANANFLYSLNFWLCVTFNADVSLEAKSAATILLQFITKRPPSVTQLYVTRRHDADCSSVLFGKTGICCCFLFLIAQCVLPVNVQHSAPKRPFCCLIPSPLPLTLYLFQVRCKCETNFDLDQTHQLNLRDRNDLIEA